MDDGDLPEERTRLVARRLADELCLGYAAPQSLQRWIARSDQQVANMRGLVADYPCTHWNRTLEAALEWQRQVRSGTFSVAQATRLVRHVEHNKGNGMPWVDLGEEIANWAYSNGISEGLDLSYRWWLISNAGGFGSRAPFKGAA